MNDHNKTKEELITELQEVKKKYHSLKAEFEQGSVDKAQENLILKKTIVAAEDFISYDDEPDYEKILHTSGIGYLTTESIHAISR